MPLTTLKPLSTIMAEFSSPPRRSRGSRAVPKFPASASRSVRKTALRFASTTLLQGVEHRERQAAHQSELPVGQAQVVLERVSVRFSLVYVPPPLAPS